MKQEYFKVVHRVDIHADIFERKARKYPKLKDYDLTLLIFRVQGSFTSCSAVFDGTNTVIGVCKRNTGDKHLMWFAKWLRFQVDHSDRYLPVVRNTLATAATYIETRYAGDTRSQEAGFRLAYSRALDNFIQERKL